MATTPIPASQPVMPPASTIEKPQKADAARTDKEKLVVESKRVQAEQRVVALTVDDVGELEKELLRLDMKLTKTRFRLAEKDLSALQKEIDDIKATIKRGQYLQSGG